MVWAVVKQNKKRHKKYNVELGRSVTESNMTKDEDNVQIITTDLNNETEETFETIMETDTNNETEKTFEIDGVVFETENNS